jgi:hypothetical protein
VEVSDAQVESGLLTASGRPEYPIFISLAAECINSLEAQKIKEYVQAGGFAYVGSSSWTRQQDGSPCANYNFWLSNEMGLQCLPTYYEEARPELGGQGRWDSWCYVGTSGRGVLVEATINHRLVNHIPKGRRLLWILPQTYDECPRGETTHFAWATNSIDATVLATFEWTGSVEATSGGYGNIPLIACKNYGKGFFIYHSELASLAGWGGFSVDTFTYTFFRNAIEWAFEASGIPLIRLAPWQYPKKAAFIIRTDCDEGISPIMDYVSIDKANGVHGGYYVVTNTVADPNLLTIAETQGAIIGSHNTYHTGPDGESYADASDNIKGSLNQLESWLGHPLNTWVSPMYTSVTEQSLQIINTCGLVSAGEQGVGPYPHLALSMETPSMHYGFVELPSLEYFSDRMQDYQPILECYSLYTNNCDNPNDTMSKAIDLTYSLEGLINIYNHFRAGNLQRRAFYIEYSRTKPDVWLTDCQDIYDWWLRRSQVSIRPTYDQGSSKVTVAVSGPEDSGPFALNIKKPSGEYLKVSCSCPSQLEIPLDSNEIVDPIQVTGQTSLAKRIYPRQSTTMQFQISNTASLDYDVTVQAVISKPKGVTVSAMIGVASVPERNLIAGYTFTIAGQQSVQCKIKIVSARTARAGNVAVTVTITRGG